MEQVLIWRRMAEKWREAADEVAEPALRRCYVERAANYERLVARQDIAFPRPTVNGRLN